VNEYEPAGKVVLVAGLLGPPDMLPDAPPLVLSPLFLYIFSSVSLIIRGKGVPYEELLCRLLSPTTSPTTNPAMHNATIILTTSNLFHPPRFAICLFSNTPCLAAASFSAFGPSPSSSNAEWLYAGGLS
jgi:hypothetical protein